MCRFAPVKHLMSGRGKGRCFKKGMWNLSRHCKVHSKLKANEGNWQGVASVWPTVLLKSCTVTRRANEGQVLHRKQMD